MRCVIDRCAKWLVPVLLIGLSNPLSAQTQAQATPAPKATLFSAVPTVEEIARTKVFAEPLVTIGATPSAAETQALAQAIDAYLNAGRNDDVEPFLGYLKTHPTSPWRASLLANLGRTYRYSGFFSRALDAWQEAWNLTKASKDPKAMLIADWSGAELADLDSRLGRSDQLELLLKELEKRPLRGSASTKVQGAREGLNRIKTTPERNFRCGPLSLASLRSAQGRPEPKLLEENGAPSGTSLLYNQKLGQKYQLDLQMAKRESGAKLILPSVMHWRSGHFAALVREANGRYLMQDPTFGDDLWISQTAIEDEASGYALVPQGTLPAGWRSVPESEGMKIMGRGGAANGDPNATGSENNKEGGGKCKGMAVYAFHSLLASLYVTDIPVGYMPPKGPSVEFLVSYSQKEINQPQTFTYSNLGPKWTFNFLAYIQDDPTVDTDLGPFSMSVKSYERGGGAKTFSFQNTYQRQPPSQPESGPSRPQKDDQSVLIRAGLNSYVRLYPDGRKEFYELPDGSRVYPRKVFLTKVIDRLGATLSINYDSQFRVTSLVDALGTTTTLSYEQSSDPLKITKVTDPFGRTARFEYNTQGQLQRITDVVGITSEFAYGPTAAAPGNSVDFMNALITPYGTTQFSTGVDTDGTWIQAQDPLGGKEKMEFKRHPVCAADSNTQTPPGMTRIHPGGSFYWDQRAMALYPDDRDRARYTRWVVGMDGEGSIDVPHSIKTPENTDSFTQWFAYPGQQAGNGGFAGTLNLPNHVVQTAGDGRFSETTFEYNDLGRPTKTTSPSGRQTTFIYADNKLDLLEVRQTGHGQNDLLAKYTYNDKHLPLTATDASGKTTTMAYNAAGQITTITNPKNQAITLVYNTLGQLTDVNGLGGNHSGFTYDAVGRVKTVTNPENEAVTMEYDDLDRPTKVTYPDNTYERMAYDRLDVVQRRDRGGKWTSMTYNSLRQLVEIQDALGRITRLDWCSCGSLDSLTDPLGQTTNWLRDLEGRVVGKLLPDRTRTEYVYDLLGRLVQRVDAKGQITKYDYNLDNSLRQVSYANTVKPASSISYTYDPDYNRLVSMMDKTGTTQYTYYPITNPPTLGAGRLATETSPMANSTVAYTYDDLGRVIGQGINGSNSSVVFDTLGRVSQVTNPLGLFNYTYHGSTGRLTNVGLPNGMNTGFAYYDVTGQHRLKGISHTKSTTAAVSKFSYTYDADGQIKTWTQTADVQTPKVYTFTYDAVGQILQAQLTGINGAVLKQYVYGYDLAGNRTSESIDGNTSTSTYNDGNQLIQLKK